MSSQPPTPLQAITHVGRCVFLELIRRKDFYVLIFLMGLFSVGVLAASLVGVQTASVASFLLNIALVLSSLAAHILTLALSARQLPDELENRTLHPLLAKPISRTLLIVGKWAACALCGFCVFLILMLMGWLAVPKLGDYSFALFLQLIALQFLSLSLIAALAQFGSLVAPKGVVLGAVGLWYLFGGQVTQLLIGQTDPDSAARPVARWVLDYLPNFSKLSPITRYTDEIGALGAATFLGLVLYGILFIAVCLAASSVIFHRRPL